MTTNLSLLLWKKCGRDRERKLGWESLGLKCNEKPSQRGSQLEAAIIILMFGSFDRFLHPSVFLIAPPNTHTHASHSCPLSLIPSRRDQRMGNGLWMH